LHGAKTSSRVADTGSAIIAARPKIRDMLEVNSWRDNNATYSVSPQVNVLELQHCFGVPKHEALP
jgi:hypothetical protein